MLFSFISVHSYEMLVIKMKLSDMKWFCHEELKKSEERFVPRKTGSCFSGWLMRHEIRRLVKQRTEHNQ